MNISHHFRSVQKGMFLILLVFLPLHDVEGIVNVSLALSLIVLAPDYRNLYPVRYIILAWAVFALWYFASSFWSDTPEYVYSGLRKEVLYSFVCFILAYSVASHLKSLRPVLYAAILALVLLTLTSVSRGIPEFMPFMLKYYPAVGDGSTSLIFFFSLAITLLCSKNQKLFYTGLAVSLISLGLGLFYENRMFFITLGAMIAFFLIYKTHGLSTKAKMGALAGIFVIGFTSLIFSLSIKSTSNSNYIDNAVSVAKKDPRIFMWDFYIDKGFEKPLIGYGAGYKSIRDALWEQFPANFDVLNKSHAHNVFLNKWLQMGFVGFSIFLMLYSLTLHQGYRGFFSYKEKELKTILLLIFIGFFCKSITDDFFIRNNLLLFWASCGFILGRRTNS